MIDAVILSQLIDGDVGAKVAAGGDNTAFQTQTGAYVGGQPVGLAASGFVFGSAVNDGNYIGMFYNNALIDTNVGTNAVGTTVDLTQAQPTILWKHPTKVRMYKGTRHNVADVRPPFASGVTWAVGDHMYISAAHGGEWTNVSAAGLAMSHGRVLAPPASVDDVLEAEMFDTPQKYTANAA